MNTLHEYRIPFVGLKNGLHYFNFEVNDGFFEHFETSLVAKGKVFVDISLDRRTHVMTLTFDIGGQVHTECDRCLEPVDIPIHGHHKLFVKISHNQSGSDPSFELDKGSDDVLLIGQDATHIELAGPIHEFIQLSVPIQRNCDELPEDQKPCNQEVIKKLNGEDVANKKEENEKPIDPRWDKLRNL
ncbi:MAG: hypothetical protein ACI959_000328 [Limisphaerales bacterium]